MVLDLFEIAQLEQLVAKLDLRQEKNIPSL